LGGFIWFASCGLIFAADPAEPQPFAADIAARPINEGPTSDAPLRWKSKPRVAASEYYTSESSAQPIQSETTKPLRAGWNITRIDPGVRPAQYTSSDPFHDPFGDRKANHTSEPSLVLQPTQAEAGVEELPPPRTLSPVRRPAAPNSVMTTTQPGMSGAAPRRPYMAELQDLPSVGPFGPERTGPPCDRVYNDRDCCDVQLGCNEFRQRLLSDSIRSISLDITPRFDPSPDVSIEQEMADRMEKLRLLESRQWRNRRGQILATGKMANFDNSSVVVADDSGREMARLSFNELGDDEMCYVTAFWRLPSECSLGGLRNVERNWLASTFHYNASGLCHKPLYFEEVQLERYGHTAGPFRQPFVSGAHFIINLAALPYNMAINPPTECHYSLGYYRPGSCAPWMIPPIPLSLRGAAAEIGVALGMIYIIP
jgi:hypothetical protein